MFVGQVKLKSLRPQDLQQHETKTVLQVLVLVQDGCFFLAGGCRGHAPEALTFDHQVTKGTSTSVADVPGTFLDVFGLDG